MVGHESVLIQQKFISENLSWGTIAPMCQVNEFSS